MNLRRLTILSDCLVLLGLIILGTGWNGNANLSGAYPFHGSSVSLTGSASGAHALLGAPSLLLGLVLMVVSLVWNAVDAMER